MGIRIYQLAKDLNTESKTIINLAKGKGIVLSSHMASIEPEVAQLLEKELQKIKSANTLGEKGAKKAKEEVKKSKEKEKTPEKESLATSKSDKETREKKSEEEHATKGESKNAKNKNVKIKPEEKQSEKESFKSGSPSVSTSAQAAKEATSQLKAKHMTETPSATLTKTDSNTSNNKTTKNKNTQSSQSRQGQQSSQNRQGGQQSPQYRQGQGGQQSPQYRQGQGSQQSSQNRQGGQQSPQYRQGQGSQQSSQNRQGQGSQQSSQNRQGGYQGSQNRQGQGGQGSQSRQGQGGQGSQSRQGGQGSQSRQGQGGQGSQSRQGQGSQSRQGQGSQGQQGSQNRQNRSFPQNQQNRSYQQNRQNNFRNRRSRDNRKQNKQTSVHLQPIHQRDKKTEVALPITLKDLSMLTGVKSSVMIKSFMKSGTMIQINDMLDKDQVEMIGAELDWNFTIIEAEDLEEKVEGLYKEDQEISELIERAPVVTMMGHVDHGKTTLLDTIRSTNIAGGESGGITQHIKAYKIFHHEKPIVFLDTPGHEAFTKMRARGANVTDIVVLVVAANDGVMPTTEEAISHAKAANVKIIVAVNKVDLPEANAMKTMQQLSDKGIAPEEWGGDIGFVEVSAKTGDGVDNLLERILLEAEMMELRANPTRKSFGHVLEAKKDPDQGILVDFLVEGGTLHKGDVVLVGNTYGRVKSIVDNFGKRVNQVGPSTPVQIAGVVEIPRAGDRFIVMSSLEETKKIIDERQRKTRETKWNTKKISHTSFADFLQGPSSSTSVHVLRLILKADTQGSLEVLSKSFQDLSSDEVKVELIHQAVGGIIESDVDLADASDAVIIGFRVICDDIAQQLARHKKIDIHIYQVIYKAIDELKNILIGMYDPEEREEGTAELEVLRTFKISRIGTIAGCRVKKGLIERKNRVRIARDNIIIYDGRLTSLKHFKDDAPSVKSGFECGVKLDNYDDIKVGDRIFAYKVEKHKRKIDL